MEKIAITCAVFVVSYGVAALVQYAFLRAARH